MIWILLISLVLLCIATFFIFKKDLFAPSVIVTLVFTISCLCAIYNYDKWGLQNFHSNTVLVILSNLAVFIAVSALCYFIHHRLKHKDTKVATAANDKKPAQKQQPKIINLPLIAKIIILAIFIFAIAWNIYEVFHIADSFGKSGSFSQLLEYYRRKTSYGVDVQLPFIFRQLTKVVTALTYVLTYIVIRNLFNKDKLKHNLFYLFCILLFVVYSFTASGRMPVLKLLAAAALLIFVFANRRVKWKVNLSKKFIKIGAICLVVLLIGFYASKGLVGRNREFEPVYYVTMYAGGSIELLDLYLNDPPKSSDDNNTFGRETFYGLNSTKNKISSSDQYIKHLEFRYVNKYFVGNVYTPFRRYIADFGYFGSLLLTALYAAIINVWYLFIRYSIAKRKDYEKDVHLVLYSLVVYTLFLYSIDDQFYTVVISLNYLLLAIATFLSYKLLIKTQKP